MDSNEQNRNRLIDMENRLTTFTRRGFRGLGKKDEGIKQKDSYITGDDYQRESSGGRQKRVKWG